VTFETKSDPIDEYTVQTLIYQGPLDLLLTLIENAELDITTLALAQVTNQYLEYINQLTTRNAGDVSAFLVVAAKLLQIKSAALLPRPSVQQEADEEEDPGEALAQQLREYKKFKDLSKALFIREEMGLRSYIRFNVPRPLLDLKADLDNLTLDSLIAAARLAFSVHPGVPLNNVVAMPRIRIKEKIDVIIQLLKQNPNGALSFRRLLKSASRVEIVVSFLAMLELIKQNIVTVSQNDRFGEILIYPTADLDQYQGNEVEFIE